MNNKKPDLKQTKIQGSKIGSHPRKGSSKRNQASKNNLLNSNSDRQGRTNVKGKGKRDIHKGRKRNVLPGGNPITLKNKNTQRGKESREKEVRAEEAADQKGPRKCKSDLLGGMSNTKRRYGEKTKSGVCRIISKKTKQNSPEESRWAGGEKNARTATGFPIRRQVSEQRKKLASDPFKNL